jgi:hypothetical protein
MALRVTAMTLPPGATATSLTQNGLGPLQDKLEEVEGLTRRQGTTPTSVTFHPAMVAAKKMQKKIMDQLRRSTRI